MLSRRKRALCILIESIVVYGGGIAGKLYHISVVYIEIVMGKDQISAGQVTEYYIEISRLFFFFSCRVKNTYFFLCM